MSKPVAPTPIKPVQRVGVVEVAVWDNPERDEFFRAEESFYDFARPLQLFGGGGLWQTNLKSKIEHGFFVLRKPRRSQ